MVLAMSHRSGMVILFSGTVVSPPPPNLNVIFVFSDMVFPFDKWLIFQDDAITIGIYHKTTLMSREKRLFFYDFFLGWSTSFVK